MSIGCGSGDNDVAVSVAFYWIQQSLTQGQYGTAFHHSTVDLKAVCPPATSSLEDFRCMD